MESNFKVGDRIEVISLCTYAKNGMRGTVIAKTDWGAYAVKFDEKFKGGHDCDGRCENGFGHFINPGQMKLIQPKFSVGQVYKVGIGAETGNIIKITTVTDAGNFNIGYKTIRGEAFGLKTFGDKSGFAESLTLLTGKAIGEALKEDKPAAVKEVKRMAKAGEYIKVISQDRNYEIDTIHEVTKANATCMLGKGVDVDGNSFVILHENYVVLENYKPSKSAKHVWIPTEVEQAKKFVLDTIRDYAEKDEQIIISHIGGCENNKSFMARMIAHDTTVYRNGNEFSFISKYVTSKCSDTDEPNEWIGKAVALCKLLHKPIPSFIMGE